MRHLITEPHQQLAELATRRDPRRPYDLVAFSALPDAPVRPVVEHRPSLLRRLSSMARMRPRTPRVRVRPRPAIAVDAVTCS
jgi:hypothetical protein